MPKILLLRHGKVHGEPALYGHTDVEVKAETNSLIVRHMTLYCENNRLNLSILYSSPLARCLSLAKQVARQFNIDELQTIDDMKEMNFGLYDGISFDELHQDQAIWQRLEKFWQNPVQHPLPKAELLTGFAYRVNQAWQLITKQAVDTNQDTLVVCHGGVIRMILAHVLNIDFRNPLWYTQLSIGNGSLTSIDVNQDDQRIKHIGKPIDGDEQSSDLPSFVLEAQ